MKIFLARSYVDFGSPYEKQWVEKVNDIWKDCYIIEFPDNIPKIPMYGTVLFEWEKDFLFPLIRDSDIVFAIPSENVKYGKYKGKFGAGVILEIAYALMIGKKVMGLINGCIRYITLEDLDGYKKNKNIKMSLDMLEMLK